MSTVLRKVLISIAIIVPVGLCFFAWLNRPGEQHSSTEVMVSQDGFAIHGYDPVAFFTEGKPVRGSKLHRLKWKGANWLFSSAKHRDLFQLDSEKYSPQYGGWCAYGAASGYAADSDPLTSWTLREGKLYFNYDQSVAEKWNKDPAGYVKLANDEWAQLSASLNRGESKVYWK